MFSTVGPSSHTVSASTLWTRFPLRFPRTISVPLLSFLRHHLCPSSFLAHSVPYSLSFLACIRGVELENAAAVTRSGACQLPHKCTLVARATRLSYQVRNVIDNLIFLFCVRVAVGASASTSNYWRRRYSSPRMTDYRNSPNTGSHLLTGARSSLF
eukprot:714657-Prorocentrum_minimum.AAC.1